MTHWWLPPLTMAMLTRKLQHSTRHVSLHPLPHALPLISGGHGGDNVTLYEVPLFFYKRNSGMRAFTTPPEESLHYSAANPVASDHADTPLAEELKHSILSDVDVEGDEADYAESFRLLDVAATMCALLGIPPPGMQYSTALL